MQSVHRAHFLNELIALIPAQRAHFGKRLVRITDNNDSNNDNSRVTIHFKDGTTALTNAVIGADGIHSAVRLCLLGTDHPAARPVFSGSVSYRGLVPMDAAVEKLGAELAMNSIMLCGPGKAILSYPIEKGKELNIVVMDYKHPVWEHEKWIQPVEHGDLARLLEGWGGPARGMVEVFISIASSNLPSPLPFLIVVELASSSIDML